MTSCRKRVSLGTIPSGVVVQPVRNIQIAKNNVLILTKIYGDCAALAHRRPTVAGIEMDRSSKVDHQNGATRL